MSDTCYNVENLDYIIDNTFCKKQNKYPGKNYMNCYCYSGKYQECPYNLGDDPYNLYPGSKERRALSRRIDAIPYNLTEADEPMIQQLLKEYNQLNGHQKCILKNYSKLEGAQKRIKEYRENQKRLAHAIEEIDRLPDELTLKDRGRVRSARGTYQMLSRSVRDKVTNYDRLLRAEEIILRLVEDSWDIPRKYALPESGDKSSVGFGARAMNLLEKFLFWACHATDPRRRKTGSAFAACRVMLIVSILIGMNIQSLAVPQHIWITYLVFAGVLLASQIIAHVRPDAVWVRGGCWLGALVVLAVLGIMILVAPTSLAILKTLAILTAIFPVLAGIWALLSV